MASSAAPVSSAIPFPRAYAKRRPRVPPERRSHAILLVLPVFRFTPLALRLQIHRRFAGLPGSFRDLRRLCGAGAARAVCRFPAAASPSAYPTAVFRRSAWAAVFWAACPASVDRRHAARGPASACRFPASPSAVPSPAPSSAARFVLVRRFLCVGLLLRRLGRDVLAAQHRLRFRGALAALRHDNVLRKRFPDFRELRIMVITHLDRSVRHHQAHAGTLCNGIVLDHRAHAVRRLDLLAGLWHFFLHVLVCRLLIL